MSFSRAHWTQIYSTNPLERLNAEIKRRTNVVGIFPNDASIVRLVGAMMLEQNDEWSLNLRYTRPGTRPKRPMVRGAACATFARLVATQACVSGHKSGVRAPLSR